MAMICNDETIWKASGFGSALFSSKLSCRIYFFAEGKGMGHGRPMLGVDGNWLCPACHNVWTSGKEKDRAGLCPMRLPFCCSSLKSRINQGAQIVYSSSLALVNWHTWAILGDFWEVYPMYPHFQVRHPNWPSDGAVLMVLQCAELHMMRHPSMSGLQVNYGKRMSCNRCGLAKQSTLDSKFDVGSNQSVWMFLTCISSCHKANGHFKSTWNGCVYAVITFELGGIYMYWPHKRTFPGWYSHYLSKGPTKNIKKLWLWDCWNISIKFDQFRPHVDLSLVPNARNGNFRNGLCRHRLSLAGCWWLEHLVWGNDG